MGVSPMFAVHRNLPGTPDKKQERSDLHRTKKCNAEKRRPQNAPLLLDSIGVPIEIKEYLEHGQDAHAT
jgi:hypothetical protein